jgi:hypothetical protein
MATTQEPSPRHTWVLDNQDLAALVQEVIITQITLLIKPKKKMDF